MLKSSQTAFVATNSMPLKFPSFKHDPSKPDPQQQLRDRESIPQSDSGSTMDVSSRASTVASSETDFSVKSVENHKHLPNKQFPTSATNSGSRPSEAENHILL